MLMRSDEPVVAIHDTLQIRFVMSTEGGETIRCCVPYSALGALEKGDQPPSVFAKHRAAIEAVASHKHELGEALDGRIVLGTADVRTIGAMV